MKCERTGCDGAEAVEQVQHTNLDGSVWTMQLCAAHAKEAKARIAAEIADEQEKGLRP